MKFVNVVITLCFLNCRSKLALKAFKDKQVRTDLTGTNLSSRQIKKIKKSKHNSLTECIFWRNFYVGERRLLNLCITIHNRPVLNRFNDDSSFFSEKDTGTKCFVFRGHWNSTWHSKWAGGSTKCHLNFFCLKNSLKLYFLTSIKCHGGRGGVVKCPKRVLFKCPFTHVNRL